MGTSIVTDTGNDLSPDEGARIGLEVVPVWIVFANERMRDGVDIDRAGYYRRVAAGEVPTTESPSEEQYREVFTRLTDAGNDVVAITLSGRISKSYEHAAAAAKAFGSRVRVVDSLGSSGFETLLSYYALELAASGMAAGEIAQAIDPHGMKYAVYFVLNDLNTLARTGRLPQSVVSLGKMANISIALRMNEEGAIVAGGQSFSVEKTRDLMVDAVLRAVDHAPATHVTFGHVQNETGAQALQALFRTKLGRTPEKEYLHESSPTIAVHQGPGSVSVCAFVPRR